MYTIRKLFRNRAFLSYVVNKNILIINKTFSMNTICNLFRNYIVFSYFQNKPTLFITLVYLGNDFIQMLYEMLRGYIKVSGAVSV